MTFPSFAPAGRTALVTGGGSGLGRQLALALAAHGVTVWVAGRTEATLAETAAAATGGIVRPATCDLRDPDAVQAMFEQIGEAPDLLVNNAAGAFVALAETISPRGWTSVVDSTLNSVFYVSREWLLRRQSDGRADPESPSAILNISSATCAGGSPGTVHSGAAKSGVTSLSKTLAVEWARFGVRVNALEAGAFETEGAGANIWSRPDIKQRIVDEIPLGRIATVDEMAGPALFLLSEAAGYVTGSVLRVDGAWALNPWLYIAPNSAGAEES